MLSESGRNEGAFASPRALLALCLALWLACLAPLAAAEARVTVVLSETASTYQTVADAFVTALGGRHACQVRSLDELRDGEVAALHAGSGLIVPVGTRAMRAMYDVPNSTAPILTLLAPRDATRSLSDAGVRDSAVYIDQPPGRTLAFTRLLLPRAKRIGIVMSAAVAAASLRGYVAEAARAKLELVTETVPDQQEVPRALQRLLPQVDVLLLVPDSLVVNENTVRHILIASYRQKVPVVGFSRGLSHAGAVASLVSSPEGIGRQGGLLARQWSPATGVLPPARYANEFEMVFNRQVARSLEIDLPEGEDDLATWRKRLE